MKNKTQLMAEVYSLMSFVFPCATEETSLLLGTFDDKNGLPSLPIRLPCCKSSFPSCFLLLNQPVSEITTTGPGEAAAVRQWGV